MAFFFFKKWWEVSNTPKESLVSFAWQWGWLWMKFQMSVQEFVLLVSV